MLTSTATVSVRRGPRRHEESRRWPSRTRTRAARVSPSARPRSPATWLPAQTRNQPWQYAPICHDTPVATGIPDFNQNLVTLVEPHPTPLAGGRLAPDRRGAPLELGTTHKRSSRLADFTLSSRLY